jgi:hypothetical protein
MKVSELEGAVLDYWVAKANGADGQIIKSYSPCNLDYFQLASGTPFRPSTHWAHAGPMIERERIVAFPDGAGGWAAFVQKNPTCSYVDTTAYDEMRGPTLLIAAMRAYVASKFGDEVPGQSG